jgi:hypothetical protein
MFDGVLTSPGDATNVSLSFEYSWLPNAVQTTVPITHAAPGPGVTVNFSIQAILLQPNTTYVFRAKADGGAAGVAYGSEISFITTAELPAPPATITPPALKPPTIETAAATSIGTSSATLNAQLTAFGNAPSASVSFEYGLTDKYGSTIIADSVFSPGQLSANISGLKPGTPYHFRAMASGGPAGISYGQDMLFATSSLPTTSTVTTTLTGSPSPPVTSSLTTTSATSQSGENPLYVELAAASGAVIAIIALSFLIIQTRKHKKQ